MQLGKGVRQSGLRVGPARVAQHREVQGALEQHEATLNALSPAHRELYGETFEKAKKTLAFMAKQAVPTEKVAAVIEKGLTAKRPKARYQVDFASKAQLVATGFTPTRMLDAIFGRAMGTN